MFEVTWKVETRMDKVLWIWGKTQNISEVLSNVLLYINRNEQMRCQTLSCWNIIPQRVVNSCCLSSIFAFKTVILEIMFLNLLSELETTSHNKITLLLSSHTQSATFLGRRPRRLNHLGRRLGITWEVF